jgi:integrase
MGKVELKYYCAIPDRHGKIRHYFRIRKKYYPLPVPTAPTFMEEYNVLLAEHAPRAAIMRQGRGNGPLEKTLDWVVEKYKAESAEWKKLKPSSKEIYNRRLDYLQSRYGAADLATFTEKGVRRIRNNLKDRPSVADATVDMIGRLWRYSKEHLDMEDIGPNPAAEVAAIHTQHESAPAWPEELCAKFEASENPRLRRAYYLLRYTGQRRSDVVMMQRKHFDGTAIEVVQEKTGTFVWIPCHRILRAHFNADGIGEGPYLLMSTRGDRFRATSLTTTICNACTDFGFPGYSPHGLRHLAGAALAEAGATLEQIKSILGHLTDKEARKYIQQARRKVMAADGMRLWEVSENGR